MTATESGRTPAILTCDDGTTIAYYATPAPASRTMPGVVFLASFASDMSGSKALALEAWCGARGQAFLRFDYRGHGASAGRFEDGCVGDWAADATAALDRLTDGPQILVGSSMGGWIMLLVACARPHRVHGLVGIASAPDFTEDLMWSRMSPDIRQKIEAEGVHYAPSQYSDSPNPITRRLIEDGRRHQVLKGEIPIDAPVRLIHGMADPDVPWRTSQRLAEALRSADVVLSLIKGAGHRLSEPPHLARITAAVADLSQPPPG